MIIRALCSLVAKALPQRRITRDDGQPYLDRYYLAGRTPAYFPILCRNCGCVMGLTGRPLDRGPGCMATDDGRDARGTGAAQCEPAEFPTRLAWLPTTFLHHFRASDLDAELHNHPWDSSVSLILSGGYVEERRVKVLDDAGNHDHDLVRTRTVTPGQLNRIGKDDFHRVLLLGEDAWTIFVTGAKAQSWGFWCRTSGEYVPHRMYAAWREARRRLGEHLQDRLGEMAVAS